MSADTLPAELQHQLLEAVERRFRQAEAFFGRAFPRPRIRCDIRGQAAGMAYPQTNRLRFNPYFLRHAPHPFLREVIPHEIAHLLAYTLHGKVRPHGREWQRLMHEVFTIAPRRTHDFSLEALPAQRHAYRCGCSEHQLTTIRHNRIQRGVEYRCRHCQQPLRPLD